MQDVSCITGWKAKTKMNKNGFSKLMDFFALEWIVRI